MAQQGGRVALTTQRIARAVCPAGKAQVLLWDAVQPGLALRVYPSGRRVFTAFYRAGSGRKAMQRWLTIGDADAISLKDARDAARAKLGEVAKGSDPAAEHRKQQRRERTRLEPAMDRYEASLETRQAVKRGEVLSLLRRELLKPLGNVYLGEIDRQILAERVATVERSGRAGAARELKTRANVFLGWCVGEGLIPANPAAGWRRPRATRAQRLERPGRALADSELPAFWSATDAGGVWFGAYLRLLLMTGQRRTETARMCWEDVDLTGRVWNIPPADRKGGRSHNVPLAPEVVDLLSQLPRLARSPFVFPGRRGAPMRGWSKRLPAVYAATESAGMSRWSLHDLRRTVRSGLSALGVSREVAKLFIGQVIGDELDQIYDRWERWPERVEAARLWATHVMGMVEGGGDKVVPLRQSK